MLSESPGHFEEAPKIMTKLYVARRAVERLGFVEPVRELLETPPIADTGARVRWSTRALLAGDVAAILFAGFVAGPLPIASATVEHALWVAAVPTAWLLLFAAFGLYAREFKRVSHSTLDEVPAVFQASVLGALIVFGVYELGQGGTAGVGGMAIFAAVAALSVLGVRLTIRAASARLLEPERALLVTDGRLADLIARKLRSHPEYRLQPIGVITSNDGHHDTGCLPVLGHLHDLADVAARHGVERIILSARHLDPHEELRVLRHCRELEMKVAFVPHPFEALGQSVEVDDIEGITVLSINPPVLSRSSQVLKRALDIVGAVVGLIVLAPLMVLTAMAIRLDSRGPILFRQARVGREGRTFYLLKFRSMFTGAEKETDQLRAQSMDPHWLHLEHDPRITRVGRWLRVTSLDELPQLWNVLKGEMSLVGPRPLIASEDELILGYERARLKLLPGLTGSWQVLGRTTIPFEEMVALDYLYVVNWSLWGDFKLILKTIPVVLTRSGAN
jgi:exopolysaccharide biosynthesis polyprenyl glycosylphosphotransferase